MCCPAPQPVCFTEPSCAYDQGGVVGYGPSFGGDCCMEGCSGCSGGGCESGCCGGMPGGAMMGSGMMEGAVMEGGVITAPAPAETILDPGPATE